MTMPGLPLFPARRRTAVSTVRGVAHWVRARLPGDALARFVVAPLQLDYAMPRDSLFAKHLAKYGAYEPQNSNWVLRSFHGRTPGLFVDVGANFGWYSLMLARCAQAAPGDAAGTTVVAIEPDPASFELLQGNLSRNRIESVVALRVGVGAQAMTATLSDVERGNPGARTVRPVRTALAATTIEIKPLDVLLAPYDGPIALLKMDIEGYEMDALMGAPETLARTDRLLVEYSPRFLRACGHNPADLLALLRDAGFEPRLVGDLSLIDIEEAGVGALVSEREDAPRSQIDLVFERRAARTS